MGRIVLLAAEMENLIELIIEGISGITQPMIGALMGQSAIRKKVEVATRLAQAKSPKLLAFVKDHFNADFDEFLRCRNVLAHGVFLGISEKGYYAFKDLRPIDYVDDQIANSVLLYNKAYLQESVEWGEKAISQYVENFQLQELRKKYLSQHLQAHPKAQGKAQASSKPQPQQRP